MATNRDFILTLRDFLIRVFDVCFQKLAKWSGYPTFPGMPIKLPENNEYFWTTGKALLPHRSVQFPPLSQPKNYFEVIFGGAPKIDPLTRVFYESQEDGFFSFYILNYKNVIFLPNFVSEKMQIYLHFCTDISFLETLREVTFISFVTYSYLISFRLLISWLININPYTFPLAYFVSLIDWFEDWFGVYIPMVFGVHMATPILYALIGKAADWLNHLVFTMPYLPREGIPEKMIINGEVKDVLVFKYLPVLWYKYPIPNELREYWYNERPDILEYLQKAYANYDIQFLPDGLIGLNSEFYSLVDTLLGNNLI